MLTLGILGLGEGRSTMSAALQSNKWELRTICDRKPELVAQREKEFDFHSTTSNYQDMLNYAVFALIKLGVNSL